MLRRLFNTFVTTKDVGSVSSSIQSGERLHFSELRYRRLFETTQDGILILDADSGRIDDVNPFLKDLLGYSKEELVGKQLWEIGLFKDIVASKEAYMELQKKGHVLYDDLPLQRKDGKSIAVEFVSNTYLVGNLRVVQCNVRDITDRKKGEEKVSLQAAALEASSNGVVITDIQGIIQWVNPAFTKLTGYTYKDAVGKSTRILNSGKQNKLFYQNLWNTIIAGKEWHGEMIDRRKDGSLYLEEQTITSVKDANGKITSFIAIQQDITEKKKLEEQLKARNQKLEGINKEQEETKQAMLNVMDDLEDAKAVIEVEKAKDEAMLASIGDGLIAVDNEKKIIVVNKAAEAMLGWKAKDLLGFKLSKLPLEDEEGRLIPIEKRPTHQALLTNKITTNTYFLVRKDKTRFPIAITVTPIILAGKVVGAVDIFRDITREKEIDRAKSEFVSVASHQLRTPLGIVKWYLEALENEDYFKKAPLEMRKYFDEIYKSNERVLSLVRDLLSVSRIDQGRVENVPKLVNIILVLKEIVNQMQVVARKKNIALNLAIQDQEISSLTIDVLRFHEVIENLIGNAIEYTDAAGIVDVSLKKVDDTVLVSVKDTGIGISEADQKKLYTKFFRSEKAIGHNTEGSGLGLYVAKAYVEGWNGKMSVSSEEGKGSTFMITIPILGKNKEG